MNEEDLQFSKVDIRDTVPLQQEKFNTPFNTTPHKVVNKTRNCG